MFIEEQQIEPIQRANFQIKHTIDLDDDQQNQNEQTLEQKYLMPLKQQIKSSSEQNIDNMNDDYSVGAQVIVNTGHHILNNKGTIRFIGETSIKAGIWYGIELDEPIGK